MNRILINNYQYTYINYTKIFVKGLFYLVVFNLVHAQSQYIEFYRSL